MIETAFCPDCDEPIGLGAKLRLGQRITCPHCQTDLEVIETLPLELDWAYDEPGDVWEDEEVEDWDDGGDDEDWEDDDEAEESEDDDY
jgi:hypothetical protein